MGGSVLLYTVLGWANRKAVDFQERGVVMAVTLWLFVASFLFCTAGVVPLY